MGHLLIFFFFQAEDGIRDHCVTGVQTCALPISAALRRPRCRGRAGGQDEGLGFPERQGGRGSRRILVRERSEERRVGKECRCRWARGDERKKKERTDGELVRQRSTQAKQSGGGG